MTITQEQKSPLPSSISVILPCHNEADNIQAVITEALEVIPQITQEFEIIVVDDGSTDQTRKVVEELLRNEPRLKLKVHPKNLGYGSALKTGFQSAEKDWIFLTDADRQFRLQELTKLIPYLRESKMVIGYREFRKDPIHRRIYGYLFSALIRFLFQLKARDVNCAFKIFDRKIVEGERLQSSGALISAELLLLAKKKGIEPKEVAVSHFPRTAGRQSGGSFKVILKAGRELLQLYLKK